LKISKQAIADARERLDRTADVYWGLHTTMPKIDGGPSDPDAILERVIADFALVSKTPIDIIKRRAKERLEKKHAAQS
jgi:hypothetical protein